MDTPVYRTFDQETLDREYRARDTVSPEEFQATLARYASETARMRDALPCLRDLFYGPTAAETLDLYLPSERNGAGAPVFLYIHGGYWRLLGKEDSGFMAEAFTAQGIAVAALNYALAPAVTLDEIVRQVRASIAWLYREGPGHGIDRERIFVGGSSAGGHLTGMALAGGWQDTFGLPPDVVKGGTAISGLFDLEPIRLSHVNEWLGLDAEAARRNSPLHHLPDHPAHLVITCGGLETAEFKRQSEEYAAAWEARGFPCVRVDMAHFHHFNVVLELNNPDSPLTQAVFAQIETSRLR